MAFSFNVLTTPRILSVVLLFLPLCTAELLPGIVSDVSELSTFFKLLNSTPDLYDAIKQGGVTVLAPTNDAMAAAGLTDVDTVGSRELEAQLSYQVLRGYYASATFSGETSFWETMLDDKKYTNKTGGQEVESRNIDGAANFLSGVWSKSKIVTGDIFYAKGLMHSVDKVFEIPEQHAETIFAAQLTNYVALGAHTQLASSAQDLPLVSNIQILPDVTILAPNSSQYSSDFTGWDGLNLDQQLEIWKYHMFNGSVLYSTALLNGSTFTTAAGLNITTWIVDGEIYINDAKITSPDLLTANGVIQVLDKPLDPNNTNAIPPALAQKSTSISSENNQETGLSTGAKAGIGVGVAVGVIALASGLAYLLIQRRKKSKTSELMERDNEAIPMEAASASSSPQSAQPESISNEMATKSNTWEIGEMDNKPELSGETQIWELGGDERKRYELL